MIVQCARKGEQFQGSIETGAPGGRGEGSARERERERERVSE